MIYNAELFVFPSETFVNNLLDKWLLIEQFKKCRQINGKIHQAAYYNDTIIRAHTLDRTDNVPKALF